MVKENKKKKEFPLDYEVVGDGSDRMCFIYLNDSTISVNIAECKRQSRLNKKYHKEKND